MVAASSIPYPGGIYSLAELVEEYDLGGAFWITLKTN